MELVAEKRGRHYVSAELRRALADGEIRPGQKLRSTKELSSQYGVALNTAQEALGELVREGLLTRKPGRGTFVLEPKTPARAPSHERQLRCPAHLAGCKKTLSVRMEGPLAWQQELWREVLEGFNRENPDVEATPAQGRDGGEDMIVGGSAFFLDTGRSLDEAADLGGGGEIPLGLVP